MFEVIIGSEKVLVSPINANLLGNSLFILQEKLPRDYLRGMAMQKGLVQVHQLKLTIDHMTALGRPLHHSLVWVHDSCWERVWPDRIWAWRILMPS